MLTLILQGHRLFRLRGERPRFKLHFGERRRPTFIQTGSHEPTVLAASFARAIEQIVISEACDARVHGSENQVRRGDIRA